MFNRLWPHDAIQVAARGSDIELPLVGEDGLVGLLAETSVVAPAWQGITQIDQSLLYLSDGAPLAPNGRRIRRIGWPPQPQAPFSHHFEFRFVRKTEAAKRSG